MRRPQKINRSRGIVNELIRVTDEICDYLPSLEVDGIGSVRVAKYNNGRIVSVGDRGRAIAGGATASVYNGPFSIYTTDTGVEMIKGGMVRVNGNPIQLADAATQFSATNKFLYIRAFRDAAGSTQAEFYYSNMEVSSYPADKDYALLYNTVANVNYSGWNINLLLFG